MAVLHLANRGADILSTNYWDSDHAKAGFCYLSGNAGVWRLLVPAAVSGEFLPEARTGRSVIIEPCRQQAGNVALVFDDGSDSPFVLSISRDQVDRALDPGNCVLAIWTEEGKALELPCSISAIPPRSGVTR